MDERDDLFMEPPEIREEIIQEFRYLLEELVPTDVGSGEPEEEVPTWKKNGDLDLVKQYLKEAGVFPLLTKEEEIELAKRIEAGDRDAFNRMVECNLRLVISVAKRYRNQGVPLLDLIEEGNLGLMRAAKKFDYRLGNRFSTYATHWIRQFVSRAVQERGDVIRTPVHVAEKMVKFRSALAMLSQISDHEPTDQELAEILGTTPEKIRSLRASSNRTVSLSAPSGEEKDAELIDFIPDESAVSPERQTDATVLRETMGKLLDRLSPRERAVIRRRYGFDENPLETLESIGQDLGVTRERVRQIEMRVLHRMRHPSFSRQLEPFMEQD